MATLRLDPALEVIPSALLARASTDHQGETVEHQVMAIQEWAKQLSGRNSGEKFTIRPQHVFKDEGESAWKQSILHRPAVKQFIEAARRGEVRCLFIKGISRFNRDDADARMFFDVLDGMGVRVLSLEEGFDSRDRGGARQIFSVHSFLAQMESDKKSVSVKIGLRQKAKKGEWKGGIPPYGFQYNPETKKLEPIQALKPVILDIYALAEDGKGPARIAHHFNETKKWTHLDPRTWSVTQVQRILTRRVYVGDLICGVHNYKYSRTLDQDRHGEYVFGKKKRILELAPERDAVVTEDAHEGIISREQFERVQSVLNSRKRDSLKDRPAPNARYPLTGILVCGHCGGPMIHHGRNPEKGYQYYCCANKMRKGKAYCDQENVRSDYLHELILLELEDRLNRLRSDADFWDRFKTNERSTANQVRRLAEIEAQIEQAVSNLTTFVLTSSNLSDSIKERVTKQAEEQIKGLEADKARLQQELEQAATGKEEVIRLQRDVEELFRKGLDFSPNSTSEELRELFHKWIDRVTLHNVATNGQHRTKDVHIKLKVETMFGLSR